jgi:DNA repair exonuclease SbcCD ATPase subunit
MQQLERTARTLVSGEHGPEDRQSLADIASDMNRQQLERRMRESASGMRERSGSQNGKPQDSAKSPDGQRQAGAQDSAKSPDGQRQAGAQDSARSPDGQRQAGAQDSSRSRDGQRQAGAQDGSRNPDGQRQAGAQDGSRNPDGQRQAASNGQGADEKQIADALDAIAKRLGGAAGRGGDSGANEVSDQLAQVQRTEQQMKEIERRVERLQQQIQQLQESKAGGQQGNADQLAKLQAELQQALKEGEGLISELARAKGEMLGGTPQGQQLSQSAPGTDSFKQDFSKWESLKKGMTLALEQVQVSLAQKLAEKQNRERLNAGANDRVPDEYRKLVDKYYESLAKKP